MFLTIVPNKREVQDRSTIGTGRVSGSKLHSLLWQGEFPPCSTTAILGPPQLRLQYTSQEQRNGCTGTQRDQHNLPEYGTAKRDQRGDRWGLQLSNCWPDASCMSAAQHDCTADEEPCAPPPLQVTVLLFEVRNPVPQPLPALDCTALLR